MERIERRTKIIRDQIKARSTVEHYKRMGPSLGMEEEDEHHHHYGSGEDDEDAEGNGPNSVTTWQLSSKPEWLDNSNDHKTNGH